MTNSNEREITIKINKGLVKGKVSKSCLGETYYSFLGMRYAQPPLGTLRFKAPQDVEPWKGVYDATKEGNPCLSPEWNSEKLIGDEDCLFINVFTNSLPDKEFKQKAVIFWIHGGGYYRGSGNTELYGPDFLISKDIVLVTFNYRLGFFGLVSFEDPEIDIPGNAFLKDMVKALEWVRDNISYFDGNPNNVTLFGESTGGIAVHHLNSSKLTIGLYHKIIVHSSTNFLEQDEETYKRRTKLLAKLLGCQSENERDIYNFLLNLNAEQIVEGGNILLNYNKNQYLRTFDPVIETKSKTEKLLLTHTPNYYLYNPHINPVPILIGSTSEDGMIYVPKITEDRIITPNIPQVKYLVPLHTRIDRNSPKAIEIGEKIKNFYYGKAAPTRRNLDKFVQLITDLRYRLTTKRFIMSMMKFHPNNPIYFFRFSLDSPFNVYKKIFRVQNLKGACHADELTYLFRTKYHAPFPKASIEELTMLRMVTFWTNFAKYGDPNPLEPISYINTKWEKVKPGCLNHLDIGEKLVAIESQPDDDRIHFWDKLHEELDIKWI